jgi:hypothetical protein
MKIVLKKINSSKYETYIFRSDNTTEGVVLDTNTYFLHDICHFYVEQELKTLDGFWGMLSKGYKIGQLFGKTNELTEKLRQIEGIVGGTQSVYSQHMKEEEFWNIINATGLTITNKDFINEVVPKISLTIDQWKYLPIGNSIELFFEIK